MDLIFILEIIGTVAFAVSGAYTAIVKEMDIFGVAVLGMTTAVGGGIIRDLILGVTPPMAFQNPVYALLSIVVSILVFLSRKRRIRNLENTILLIMDTIGLGVFTIVGVRAGMPYDNVFLSVFVGSLTGVGGGVLRDLFAGNRPSIFVKHFYASASLIGALVTTLIWDINANAAMIIGAITVIVLRLLAAHYRWSLPKA